MRARGKKNPEFRIFPWLLAQFGFFFVGLSVFSGARFSPLKHFKRLGSYENFPKMAVFREWVRPAKVRIV